MLLERATGGRDLVRMVEGGKDDEATRIICAAAEDPRGIRCRARRPMTRPSSSTCRPGSGTCSPNADRSDAFHRRGADIAAGLLDDPRDAVVLHGDLHHGNVLDFGERGWLAIDPKGLLGEAAFDYCNLLCNPSHERALAPGRLERQFGVVVEATGIEPARLRRLARRVVRPVVDVVRPRRRSRGSRTPPRRSASGPWRWRSALTCGVSG